ncbi:protein FAM200B-like, partial [Penaeus monodon]|uniref:protein FAM200B-like n=1 Tax=Penaeus monodon TaxID=6687 RepID=UPI0018A7C955
VEWFFFKGLAFVLRAEKRQRPPCNQSVKSQKNSSTGFFKVRVATQYWVANSYSKKVKSWTRQYSDEFLKYGFVISVNRKRENQGLRRHLETKHPSLATKPVDYFQRRKEQLKMSVKVLNTATTLNDKAQLASYIVSYRIAKEKVPYTCGEKLILPSCVDIVSTMLDGKSADKIKCVPISDTTVSRRISDIADLQTAGEFAIQLDEGTDISNCAVLLVYVRYVHEDDFLEDMLCCLTLPTHSSGSEIYRVLNDCIVGKYKLKWANYKGITTDGAANMTGKKSGVVTKISEAAGNDVTWRHCFIHREALAAKGIPDNLRGVLNDVVKVINNTIKGSALNSRLFELLCLDMGTDHSHLLYHTEVRWLSRGRILTRHIEEHNNYSEETMKKLNVIYSCTSILCQAVLNSIFLRKTLRI